MKITRIDVYHTAVPYIEPIRTYRPTAHLDRQIPLIRVETDAGLVGWGEGERRQRLEQRVEAWLGRNPLELQLDLLENPWASAMYDLVGKAYGVPAWRLMGELVRHEVPVAYWSTLMDPADTGREAERAAAQGYRCYKIKAWDPDTIVAQVEHVAAAVGDALTMVLDPNFKFRTYTRTLRLARQLAPYRFIRCLEEPFPWRGALNEYRRLREKTDFAIAIHYGRPADMLDALHAEAIDEACVEGTVANIQLLAGLMEAAGKEIWLQPVGLNLGVAGAYATHVHAVIRPATLPSDSNHFWREHDLLADARMQPEGGMVQVPQEPGLGVEVDREKLEEYSTEHYTVS